VELRGRLIGCGLVALLGCGGGGGGGDAGADAPPVDPSAPLFDPEHLLVIDIELAPADWDALRVQHHDLFGRLVDNCPGPLPADPFTVYPATVTIDGQVFDQVGVRKKGFLGSINRTRPSLKLSFDEYQAGREVFGLERMTLNDNQQDPSQLDTCLAYQVFRAAGVPAPRCNWARVTVNGEDLGTYSNVESIRRRFLARWFDDTSGNLYEGAVADLRPSWVDNYEDKPGNSGDRSDLAGLVAALTTGDSGLPAALDPVLDVDAFLTFWAAEVLVGHWDGYSGDRNNHYLYRDPTSGRFRFLPWGPDSAFGQPNPFLAEPPPPSVWANNLLASRLYGLSASHAAYQQRLRDLLDQAWDETALTAEIDRVEAMLAPYTHVPAADFAADVARVRGFVAGQRATLTADLDTDPSWNVPLPDGYCLTTTGTATGTFSAPIGAFPPANIFAGTGTLEVTLGGNPVSFVAHGAGAGPDGDPSHPRIGAASFGVLGTGTALFPYLLVEPELWVAGDVAVDGYDVFGLLLESAGAGGATLRGFLRGTLTLDQAPTTAGQTASGSFDLEVIGIGNL